MGTSCGNGGTRFSTVWGCALEGVAHRLVRNRPGHRQGSCLRSNWSSLSRLESDARSRSRAGLADDVARDRFTPAGSAGDHCRLGNPGPALRTMLNWLDQLAPNPRDVATEE